MKGTGNNIALLGLILEYSFLCCPLGVRLDEVSNGQGEELSTGFIVLDKM